MTARLKPASNGVTSITSPAPASVMPDALAGIFAEHRRLTDQLRQTGNENAALRAHANEDDHAARRADAEAAAAAVRNGDGRGDGDPTATPHMDALKARRAQVAHREAALADAIAAVEREIQDAMYAWTLTGEPAKTAADAAAKLAKAASAYAKALGEASAARGVVEWLAGAAYSEVALVRMLDLDPALSTMLGGRGADLPAGIDAQRAIRAITATLTEENAHV